MFEIILLLAMSFYGGATLDEKVTLLEPPEDAGFLQGSANVTLDEKGNFYLLDAAAYRVFVWNPEGEFLRTFGGKGQGPGEFGFNSRMGLFGYLSVVGETSFVYDAALKRITGFNAEGEVLSTKNVKAPVGSVYNFFMVDDQRFILDVQDRGKETPMRNVSLYNQSGEVLEEILSVPDKTFARKMKDGREVGIIFKVFAPTLVTNYDSRTGNLVYGMGNESFFHVYNLETRNRKKVSLKVKRYPVTDEDRAEHDQITWIKQNPYFSVSYEENHPYFGSIIPLEKGFLVCNVSPFYRNLKGVIVDENGATREKLEYPLGEDGNLYASRGKLIYSGLNEDGDIKTRLVELSY